MAMKMAPMTRSIPMGLHSREIFLTLALVLGASPAIAGWREEASPPDIDRLVQLPQIRAAAIEDAQHSQGRGDGRVMSRVMGSQGHAIPLRALMGDWRCRQF